MKERKTEMIRRELKEHFQIRIAGEETWYPMTVPGSAMDSFARAEVLPDPYYGTNEKQWTEFFRNDFEIQGIFSASAEECAKEEILLVFYGIDTVADIFLNGTFLGHTENMHRTYTFSVKEWIKKGENLLEIHLTSPIRFVEAYQPEPGREIEMVNTGTMPGSQYIRKAHSMFGWDWGPQLPDAGLFRNVELICFQTARLGETLIRQEHKEEAVTIHLETEILYSKEYQKQAADVETQSSGNAEEISKRQDVVSIGPRIWYELRDPSGNVLYAGEDTDIEIQEPKLWWPRGYGRQPLYTLRVCLNLAGKTTEIKRYRVGLRTLNVSREKDQWGEEFAFQVNGVKIFAKGADYIPDDCFYSRITEKVLERDIKAAVFANFNCLRVWGGGYYPSEAFYDLCDEAGILVWQDLMYACNIYDLTDEFIENISQETRDNLLRIRNHACLGLICGNNEMELAWLRWDCTKDHAPSLKKDYLLQFEYILPKIVKETAPDAFYWPSSPSSGGSFDLPWDENRGDSHYWEVWHGQKPFSEYMKHYFRFCSEFGFQSLPSIKTVETFTEEEDRNLFSRVMENHQKNPAANGKILYYLSETFRYPKDLESLIFLSQILQGYAMKEAAEHWRRNRGRCMGSVYWQFNDDWPVASWSSMDYYGRYKALHYMAKNFFDDVAGSIEKQGTKMGFWISNETMELVKVKAKISVKKMDFQVLEEKKVELTVPALSAQCLFEKDYGELVRGREDEVFLVSEYEYASARKEYHKKEFETFVPIKYLKLRDPGFAVSAKPDGSVVLSARSFVPYCMLEGIVEDTVWSENVTAVTDSRPMILKPEKGTQAPKGGVRIYDVYHTYH